LNDCDRDGKRKMERELIVRDSSIWGGRKNITFLESSQASPARPSGGSRIKVKVYEDVRIVTIGR
jgi:hypothetical protein